MRPARPIDLSLYLVLDPGLCERSVGIIETALGAVRAGAGIVQLRAPDWKKRRMVECARALKAALSPFGVPLVIDDHADVALAADADGLHVGQADLSVADARALIGFDRILGLSIGSPEEARSADWEAVDYVGIGPVFATKTKPDAGAALGADGLRAVIGLSHRPTVAIGGIGAANAAEVARAGAGGAAVISAICGTPDPEAAAAEILRAYRSGRRA